MECALREYQDEPLRAPNSPVSIHNFHARSTPSPPFLYHPLQQYPHPHPHPHPHQDPHLRLGLSGPRALLVLHALIVVVRAAVRCDDAVIPTDRLKRWCRMRGGKMKVREGHDGVTAGRESEVGVHLTLDLNNTYTPHHKLHTLHAVLTTHTQLRPHAPRSTRSLNRKCCRAHRCCRRCC